MAGIALDVVKCKIISAMILKMCVYVLIVNHVCQGAGSLVLVVFAKETVTGFCIFLSLNFS